MSSELGSYNSLPNYCGELPPATVLWVSNRASITAAGLLAEMTARRAELQGFRGANVALHFEDDLLLAKALVFLDGLVGQVLLVPGEVSPEIAERFLAESASDIFITDSPARQASVRVVRSELWNGAALPEYAGYERSFDGASRWILATSGTTGIPKLVVHTLSSLARSVIRHIQKGALFRWALLYEMSRFAGLQVFFQTVLAGSTLIFTSKSSAFEDRLRHLCDHRCNAISATPSMWRKIMMSDAGEALRLKQITLGGEIADQKLLTALADRFPDARIVHIYASTEAGVGFTVKDGQAGFPSGWITDPPPGISLQVDSAGTLHLRAEGQNQRYLQDDVNRLVSDDGYICTGDIVRNKGDRFLFQGRSSGAINVGGSKVHPEEVEEVLLELPDVALCRVYARANAFTGQLVVADVVPAGPAVGVEELKTIAFHHCRARLPAFKVPALVNVVKDLSLSQVGKVIR